MSAEMTTIQVDRDTAEILRALKVKAEAQGVTLDTLLRPLTENGSADEALLDLEYMNACLAEADPTVTLDAVREALSKIPGSMTPDFVAERDER